MSASASDAHRFTLGNSEQPELQSVFQSNQLKRSPGQSESQSESLFGSRQFEPGHAEGAQSVRFSSHTEGDTQGGAEQPQDPYTRPNDLSGLPPSRIPRRSTQPHQGRSINPLSQRYPHITAAMAGSSRIPRIQPSSAHSSSDAPMGVQRLGSRSPSSSGTLTVRAS